MAKLLSGYTLDTDLADEIGCHVRTLHRAVDRGEIVEARLGRLRLIDVKKSRAKLAELARKKAESAAK